MYRPKTFVSPTTVFERIARVREPMSVDTLVETNELPYGVASDGRVGRGVPDNTSLLA